MNNFIKTFLITLDDHDIDYVHWKSNTNIEQALSGKDDLDILVNPRKKKDIYQVFDTLKIIRGYSEKDAWQNEIYHYFGIDIENKVLVHIHLHFLLEVGYDLDKSVNLPIIENYIKQHEKYKYINIPIVENEYILLIIRLLLKNALIPFILMLPTQQIKVFLRQRQGIVTGSAYNEFTDLYARIDRTKLDNSLEDTFPFLDKRIFYKCESVVKENNSLQDYFYYSGKLKRLLTPYRYHSELTSFFLSFYRINIGRLQKLFQLKVNLKKKPEFGGRIFAFIGGDGAGKSSNIEKLNNILGEHFYTETIHIGRPNLYFIGNFLLIFSKFLKLLGFNELRQAYIYLAIAYGRYKEFQKALNIRKKGGIVILDRVHLTDITSMDCPRIHTIKANKFSFLSKIEKKLHNMIDQIDILIVLKLNPKIALIRRPEDDPDELLIRSGQIWEKDFSKVENAYVINTENTFNYVEHEILSIVWKSLSKAKRG